MARVRYGSEHKDVEELQKKFEGFRRRHRVRTRLPEDLWRAAARLAERRGSSLVCRSLGLDANSLKKWMGENGALRQPKKRAAKATKKRASVTAPTFLELLAPVSGGPGTCVVEVEAPQGAKLRLEWRGASAAELAELIRGFVSR